MSRCTTRRRGYGSVQPDGGATTRTGIRVTVAGQPHCDAALNSFGCPAISPLRHLVILLYAVATIDLGLGLVDHGVTS